MGALGKIFNLAVNGVKFHRIWVHLFFNEYKAQMIPKIVAWFQHEIYGH